MEYYFGDRNPLFICGKRALTTILSGQILIEKLLEKTTDFTALICTNDLMAIGCIQKLKSLNIKVPEDISIVGIDDSSLSTLLTPSLTTVKIDYKTMGRDAFLLLSQDIISSKKEKGKSLIELVVRDSTCPLSRIRNQF